MADRGRPAKPTHLKMLHGDREDRINRNEPKPADGEIVPPFELSERGQRYWDRLSPDRIRAGVLTVWDCEAFAHFCEALVIAEDKIEAASRPAKAGLVSGMNEYKSAIATVATLGARFGWTPSDRAKLTVGGGDDGKSAGRLIG